MCDGGNCLQIKNSELRHSLHLTGYAICVCIRISFWLNLNLYEFLLPLWHLQTLLIFKLYNNRSTIKLYVYGFLSWYYYYKACLILWITTNYNNTILTSLYNPQIFMEKLSLKNSNQTNF